MKFPEKERLRYGRLLLKMGKLEQGEDVLKKAIAKGNPFYLSDYHFSTGQLFEIKKDFNKVMESYQTSLKENPYHIEASKKLQALLISSGKKQESEKNKLKMQDNLNRITTIYAL